MHFHYSGDYAVDFQRTSCRAFYVCILEVLCRTPDIADISWSDKSCDILYLGVINLVTFIVFAIDKANARANRSRIRIVTLLGLSFAGGSVGGLISMYLFRHKTQKDYFTVGMPLIIVTQIVVLFYAMNTGW